jgi:hypothetical protein
MPSFDTSMDGSRSSHAFQGRSLMHSEAQRPQVQFGRKPVKLGARDAETDRQKSGTECVWKVAWESAEVWRRRDEPVSYRLLAKR